jgi:membrane carboxypeptidase/penicillin-binding protein
VYRERRRFGKELCSLIYQSRDKQDFSIPEKVVAMDVDRVSGYPAHDGFAAKQDYFIDGTQPKTSDPIHMKLKVCKGQSGLATPADVSF